jgi:hypothetical protein
MILFIMVKIFLLDLIFNLHNIKIRQFWEWVQERQGHRQVIWWIFLASLFAIIKAPTGTCPTFLKKSWRLQTAATLSRGRNTPNNCKVSWTQETGRSSSLLRMQSISRILRQRYRNIEIDSNQRLLIQSSHKWDQRTNSHIGYNLSIPKCF